MPYTTPTVNYSATLNGTYTSLTGIQSVSINRGRQRFQDNFPQTSCVIELIPANSYALPLAVGQFIDVRDANSSSSPAYFVGAITDVSRQFAMPYKSGTGAAPQDRITITATGAVGKIASTVVDTFTPIASTVSNVIDIIASTNAGADMFSVVPSMVAVPASTFQGGGLDLVNGLLRTGQYLVDDLDSKRVALTGAQFTAANFAAGIGNRQFVFSDAGTVGAYQFSALEYLSSVQNTFTEVEVVAPGIATQRASTGSPPFNSLVYDTYNASTSDALSLAQYVLATQNLNAITPFSITTNTLQSPTCTVLSLLSTRDIVNPGADAGMNLGAGVTVIFRGTTVTAQIQGITTVFYPDYAQVQLNLSPSLGTPFTLDSSTFGVLDQNRLGYP
jgi:hypothetical protein